MSLKKIPVREVRVGMFLHKLEGSWLSHPFWRTRFLIRDEADLQALHASEVGHCWIDIGKGLDVPLPTALAPDPPPAPAAVAEAPEPAASAVAVAPAAPVAPPRTTARAPLAAELRKAAAICDQGREAVIAMFGEARMGRTVDCVGCMPLVREIADSVARNPGALISLARLKTRDDYTYMHSVAVCALMVALAQQLGLSEDDCRSAGLAGLVHDLGKALMPLEVLNKPGRLTDEEFAIMRTHPERGLELLQDAPGATSQMLDVVLHHHERVDGAGYPHRLSGEALTRLARMGAVCDVYDAITSNRPYKAGWDPAESIARMSTWRGHFDPDVFNAFVRSLGIYPTGSLVRLASGRLAVVSEQNPQALVAPVVTVYFSTRSHLPLPPQRLDLSAPGVTDRIVGREPRPAEDTPQIDALWAGADTLAQMRGS